MFIINQNLIEDFTDKINEKEKKNNKVTSWSSTTTDAHYPSEKLVKDSLDSKASSSHTHGNLQNNGQVGSTAQANKNVVTDSSGKITTENKPTIPDVSGKEDISNKTSNWNATTNNTRYPTEKLVKDSLDLKANSADLSTVATTGDYEDLLNLPEEICITDFYYDATSDELVLNTCTNNDISTITSKEDKSNKVTSWSATPTHSHYPSEKLVKDYIDDMIGNIIEYIEG